mgnify:CR=1 FL=1
MRDTAEKRHNDWKKAIRKRNLDRALDTGTYHHDWYDNLHQYSKNKIHCSCPLCAEKTNNKHIKNSWLPNTNWSMRDRKQIDKLNYQEEE